MEGRLHSSRTHINKSTNHVTNLKTLLLGIGQRANDSLAEIFDRTGYGEYESCPQHNGSYLDKDEPHHGEEEFDDKEEEEHKDGKDFALYFLYDLVSFIWPGKLVENDLVK